MMSTYEKSKLAVQMAGGPQEYTFIEASFAGHVVATTRRKLFVGQWRQSDADCVIDTIPGLLDQLIT